MDSGGTGQPDRPTCPIRDRLEKNLYEAVQILAKHSSRLVEIAGTGKLDEINETTRLIENQRLLIQELGSRSDFIVQSMGARQHPYLLSKHK